MRKYIFTIGEFKKVMVCIVELKYGLTKLQDKLTDMKNLFDICNIFER